MVWLRLAGATDTKAPPAPKQRKKWRPPVPYRFHFRLAPELLEKVEQAILELLAGPHDPRELLATASFAPPPAPGYVPYPWITPRVGCKVALPEGSRLHAIGHAVRSLARQGRVELLGTRCANGKLRVRWVRLAYPGEPEVRLPSAPAFLFAPRFSVEPARL